MKALSATQFQFENQTHFYKGKVRDVYSIGTDLLVMVACDRISAFDHVLPRAIPHKGQVLNAIAGLFLDKTRDIVPNWKISMPDPHVTIGYRCEAIPVEFVVRNYLTGHAWRVYKSGLRVLCGNTLPEGMKENDKFPTPILTPATKASEGHDEDTTYDEILEKGILTQSQLDELYRISLALFERGTEIAAEKGLILVDTKYEFGTRNGDIMLIDEIHTPDSSRFFYADTYDDLQRKGEPQRQLSKEFVREWLMENGFQGKEGEVIPSMSDEFVNSITERYEELYSAMTGSSLARRSYDNIEKQIENNINQALEKISHE
ncbi:MAG: phosphoribosylaminoimidazolesuccinocarboxamide synthase [Sphingomonadales bacterium]|nr:phosphoribosylaminoimidazolesuccinocarboxamide synthase [Sphingomonadales bacterium]